jgi:hypothetical protein
LPEDQRRRAENRKHWVSVLRILDVASKSTHQSALSNLILDVRVLTENLAQMLCHEPTEAKMNENLGFRGRRQKKTRAEGQES